jgi:hypothetical protein
VEVEMKSSFSGGNNSNGCVDIRHNEHENLFVVSDTKQKDVPNAPVLFFTRDEWVAFVKGVKAGEFDFGIEELK